MKVHSYILKFTFKLFGIFILFYFFTSHFFILSELLGIVDRPDVFSHAELKTATETFNAGNFLGEGGFGPVYKVFIICMPSTILFCACEEKGESHCLFVSFRRENCLMVVLWQLSNYQLRRTKESENS